MSTFGATDSSTNSVVGFAKFTNGASEVMVGHVPHTLVGSVATPNGASAPLYASITNLPSTWTVAGSVSISNLPATQPVSATALPLPAGAATAAKQPALGTAGVASTDVLSVQGIASGTALTIAGAVAVGSPPVNPPVSVSGVDGSGNKQHLLTDTAGRPVVSVQPASVSAMTTASVTTSSAQVLAARTGRRRLSFQNTGAGAVTLLFGTGTAVVGAGIVLASGGAAGSQGGSWEEPAHECWAGAVQAIGASASTLTIIEG